MMRMATKRRFAQWFGALFLVAQIFGVVPLMSEHAAHIAEAGLAACSDKVAHGHCHHHGDADGFMQHHELQDLCGAFTCKVAEDEVPFVRAVTISCAADVLLTVDPNPLERPPNYVLSA